MASRSGSSIRPVVLGARLADCPGGADTVGSEGAGASKPLPLRPREIAYRIRWVLCLVALVVFQGGLLGPSVQFVVTSFFAAIHGGGDCEAEPDSEPCRRGAADLALYSGVSNGASHSVAGALALLLGSWSDALGRRPFLRAKSLAALLPLVALDLHIFAGFTLWAYLLLAPLLNAFDTAAVFLACMSDLVTEPWNRTGAFGVLLGSLLVFGAVALPFGGLLPRGLAVSTASVVALVQVAFLFVVFPETARTRAASGRPPGLLAVIQTGIQVFGRNGFISRMVCVLVLSGLFSAGLGTLLPPYSMAYLGFDRKAGTALTVACGASIGASLTFALAPLIRNLGEVGTLRVSLAFSVAYPILIPLCDEQWQFTALTAVVVGPAALQFPVISAIKSNLVAEHEQGIVQGALAAVRVLAIAVSDIVFGWLYRHATRGGAAASRFAALPPLLGTAGLAGLALLLACGLPEEPPSPPGGEEASMGAVAVEDVELKVVETKG